MRFIETSMMLGIVSETTIYVETFRSCADTYRPTFSDIVVASAYKVHEMCLLELFKCIEVL